MLKKKINNVKLGVFVLASLLLLVLLLYMIGKNRNFFGNNYVLKARFENVNGLVAGNNVRFSGIQAGTVKKISILNDTCIEVLMTLDTKFRDIIRKDAVASIATDGLVGNKVVNILPSGLPGPLANEGTVIVSQKAMNTDEMLRTLYKTNTDASLVAEGLKTAVQKLNSSNALWQLLNDQSLPENIHHSAVSFRRATSSADEMLKNISTIIADVKKGKGNAGILLTDSLLVKNLEEAAVGIKSASKEADSLTAVLHSLVSNINQDIINGSGTVHSLLKDSLWVTKIHASITNIQKGTDGFNQSMEALKHSFLFRGYFKKLEKQKKKEQAEKMIN